MFGVFFTLVGAMLILFGNVGKTGDPYFQEEETRRSQICTGIGVPLLLIGLLMAIYNYVQRKRDKSEFEILFEGAQPLNSSSPSSYSAPVAPLATTSCRSCLRVVSAGFEFCPHCGVGMNGAGSSETQAPGYGADAGAGVQRPPPYNPALTL
eukprot:TRINITY_DN18153_c0_g1_i1.p1 TRINITY_DN18153_c0_g1~~TRINITY_DN18153_c0_g1_i1.p1  ORF type:complete len:152 (+),score=28.75 TRINITY_DN18153_c0_g1_i1:177-632(+)